MEINRHFQWSNLIEGLLLLDLQAKIMFLSSIVALKNLPVDEVE